MIQSFKKWICVLLICISAFVGIHGEYTQSNELAGNRFGDGTSAFSQSNPDIFSEAYDLSAQTKQELLSVRRPVIRLNRLEKLRNRPFLAVLVRSFAVFGMRVSCPTARVHNIFVRSHALIMEYIHRQDGQKAVLSFGINAKQIRKERGGRLHVGHDCYCCCSGDCCCSRRFCMVA
ncbi:MAG: hypothetical protein PUF65_01360 [Lachnospiraceae bacterium]|nr:hypothetical protein [Lachnospiraceae bacterium]